MTDLTKVRIKFTNKSIESIEDKIKLCKSLLDKIKLQTENKISEEFPVTHYKNFIKELTNLKLIVKNKSIDEQFYNEVLNNKDYYSYFEGVFNDIENHRKSQESKRDFFKSIADKINKSD
ncbi:hypothetical protein A0H76_669 [Hepatospora eriocheir]|uniref:Uncharacterized protein n=1 Tax=Hepatospora eriocheir TaxID=1081669 RepID=A0A1X0QCP8_9MICR|nr:hypothetical protein HERIO_611 [Hepatospora eriocheir]ORE00466.1 hypothetical protein A0H76_669 [Hepatospora eriocheir]